MKKAIPAPRKNTSRQPLGKADVRERAKEISKADKTLRAEIAERKRAEEALKAERERFSYVLDMLPVYLVLLSPDYHVRFANRFFRDRFGESRGKRCFEYLFGRTEPCQVCETYKVLKTKAPLEWEWTGPDGRDYCIFDFPFTDTDGATLIMEVGIDVTERKRAEQTLLASKDRYQSLFENVPISLCEVDFSAIKAHFEQLGEEGVADFRAYLEDPTAVARCLQMVKIIDINQATLRLFGAQSKDKPMEGLGRLFSGETYDVFRENLVSLAEGNTWFEGEALVRTLAEDEKWIHLTVAVAPGCEDTWSRLLVSIRDITRQKELEEHAEVYNAISRLFLETSSQPEYLDKAARLLCQNTGCRCFGIRALDEDGNIPFAWQQGFSPAFLATENHLSLKRDQCACIRIIAGQVEPEDAPALTPAGSFYCGDITEFFAGLPPERQSSYRGACLRAGFRTLAIIPIRYGGKAIGALHLADERPGVLAANKLRLVESIAPLIGEAVYRFHVEQELRRDEARLAEAQRIAHVGNWEWNIVTDDLLWSDEIYRIFGLAPQQFGATYQAFLTYIHPDDRAFVGKSVNEALYQAKPYDIDHRIVLPDGSVRTVHEKGEVTFDATGKPVRMIGTVHDITERKQTEEQLRGLSTRLVAIQEEERRSIARDLHDQVGQSLTMLNLSIERALRSSPEKSAAILADSKVLAKEIINQVREMSLSLRPSILDDLGLLPALIWHFERFTARANIDINFEHNGLNVELPSDIRTAAYRIVQEALNNVARYAGVSTATVRALVRDSVLSIQVEDHGLGFDPEKVASTSSGINGMEERARLLGGTLAVDSAPGIGTYVSLELPLPNTPAEEK